MSKEIIVAIVSGIVGLAGGIIASVQAVRTSRLKADTDAALERIRSEASIALENVKADQERRRRAFELALEDSKPAESALAQAWQDIQTIKDVLSRYTAGFRFDEDSAMEAFRSSFVSLSEGYAKWGPAVPESARQAWHAAKGRVGSAELLLLGQSNAGDDASPLPPRAVEGLREIRMVLSDCQMAIAASREGVRDALMKRMLGLM
jgi:hypothetical protein